MFEIDRSEYLSRIDSVKQRMRDAGIDVLLLSDPKNLIYLTGYNGQSFYVPQFGFLGMDEKEPYIVTRQLDVSSVIATAFIKPEHIIGYPEHYLQAEQSSPNEMNFMTDFIHTKGWHGKRLGLEMDAYYFAPRDCERLKASLPNAKWVDASGLVSWVRIIKSPAEIERMRRAGVLAQHSLEVGIDAMASGIRECDVCAKIVSAQLSGNTQFGADRPIWPTMPSGKRTSCAHLSCTDQPYETDTPINVESGAVYKDYAVGLSRSIYLGKPPHKLVDLASVTNEGFNAALEAARPGETCESVNAAWAKSIGKHGYSKESRLGYSIGIDVPPDWAEHNASLRQGDLTVLQPNMTFHLIGGMWSDEVSYIISETFRMSENGCEVFSTMPRQLFVKA